jgi:hypothetical protein
VLFLSVAGAPTASAQDSVANPVPLLNGTERAKLLYSIPWVYSNANVATCVTCTDTSKNSSGAGSYWAVEFFENGMVENDLTASEGVEFVDFGGDTDTICTRNPASGPDAVTAGTDAENNIGGAARVVATTKTLMCAAYTISVAGDPPTSITMLPMYRSSKQKGGM